MKSHYSARPHEVRPPTEILLNAFLRMITIYEKHVDRQSPGTDNIFRISWWSLNQRLQSRALNVLSKDVRMGISDDGLPPRNARRIARRPNRQKGPRKTAWNY